MPHRPSDSTRPRQRLRLSGDVHQNPGPTKYPCSVCTRNVTSRGVSYMCNRCSSWVHYKCSGLQNAIKNRACSSCRSPPTHKVAVIPESKLTLNYRTPNTQNFTTMIKYHHQGQGGGLLTLIHKSINFSLRPDSPDTLADPHLEELTITAKLGNTDHYQRLHTPRKLLHRRIQSISGSSDDVDGQPHTGRLQCSPLIVVFKFYRFEKHYVGEHGILL